LKSDWGTEDVEVKGGVGAARDDDHTKQSDNIVFMQSYIPRRLNDVYDPERDVDMINREGGEKLIYSDVIGVMGAAEGVNKLRIVDPSEGRADSEVVSEDCGKRNRKRGGEEGFKASHLRGHRNEDKASKKCVFLLPETCLSC